MYKFTDGRTPREVYDELHATMPAYGHTDHGAGTEHLIADCQSILDVGCGTGDYALNIEQHSKTLHKKTKNVALCDISVVAVAVQMGRGLGARVADLSEGLPYADGEFEAVTCFDVLEHIEPERVDFAIRELARVASRRIVLTIGTFACHKDTPQLHLTVHPTEWWLDKLAKETGGDVAVHECVYPVGHQKAGKAYKAIVVDLTTAT
jgi:ubiquinone/menaquinone biosynthesis C-methylase UbiE